MRIGCMGKAEEFGMWMGYLGLAAAPMGVTR